LFQSDTANKANLHSKKSAIIKKALSPDPIRYSASPKYMLHKAAQQKLETTNVSTKIFHNRSEVTHIHGAALIAQSPEVKTTKFSQPRSHRKQANTNIKFPRHSRDVFARFGAKQRPLSLKTTP